VCISIDGDVGAFSIDGGVQQTTASWLPRVRSLCRSTEAGMFAIRATVADMLEAVQKVIKGYAKSSATPKYMVYKLS
jgi:ATP-dependent 26S proteasome regulatory subunit